MRFHLPPFTESADIWYKNNLATVGEATKESLPSTSVPSSGQFFYASLTAPLGLSRIWDL